MSCVCVRMAGTSLATKYSLSPMPMTTGGPDAGGDDLVRVGARDHGQREDAGDFLHGGAHGLFQIAFEVLLDQVRDDFGIGLGLEDVAFLLQLLLEREIVFDDAVVHHDDIALAIAVRVRILFGGTPVGCPARVADAEGAIDRVHADGLFQIAQLALGAADCQLIIVAIDRETGRIVASDTRDA